MPRETSRSSRAHGRRRPSRRRSSGTRSSYCSDISRPNSGRVQVSAAAADTGSMLATTSGQRASATLQPPPDASPHPRVLGWVSTTALALGGSNQSLFLLGALLLGQGSGAVP